MTAFGGFSDEYRSLARRVLDFVAGRRFDSAGLVYEIYPGGNKCTQYFEVGGVRDESGPMPAFDITRQASAAAVSLARAAETQSGARVWGLAFVLFPDGRCTTTFSYDPPDWWSEEDEETICVSPLSAAAMALPSDVQEAVRWLEEATADHKSWGLGTEAEWHLDMSTGLISWRLSSGDEFVASAQIVGTFNVPAQTFMWGWDHPSVPEGLRAAAVALREWAQGCGQGIVEERIAPMDEFTAWVWSAMAAKLHGDRGVYRGRAGDVWVYVAFGAPQKRMP